MRTLLLMMAAAVVLAACNQPETALARGDRLWADSSYTAALAEYRLAVVQGGGSDEARARVAHAYATVGQLERAIEQYDRVLADAPEYREQAVMDYLAAAERARRRGDRFGLATAVDAVARLRPDLPLSEHAIPLARYYAESGEPERALEYYRRALPAAPPDSVPRLLYEIGVLHEQQERCDRAMEYLNAVEVQAVGVPPLPGERGEAGRSARRRRWAALLAEANWHRGTCAFRLARQARETGRASQALAHLEMVIELGRPESLLDRAWFERGEILYGLGRFDDALASYRRVLELNPTRTGQLVERAQQRIDQIRFGRPAPDRPLDLDSLLGEN